MTSPPTFVLVHSPLVGPATWQWVAEALRAHGHASIVPSALGFHTGGAPYWPAFVDAVVDGCTSIQGPLVLAGHSGAGPLLPVIADRLDGRVEHVVWVEASLPPPRGRAELAPEWLRDRLRSMAHDGVLPRWSDWWGPVAVERLVPDELRRQAIVAQLPTLPLDYFAQQVPMPKEWEVRTAPRFLWFSDAYADDATAASDRGWPVVRIDGGHLHMAVDPSSIARALAESTTA